MHAHAVSCTLINMRLNTKYDRARTFEFCNPVVARFPPCIQCTQITKALQNSKRTRSVRNLVLTGIIIYLYKSEIPEIMSFTLLEEMLYPKKTTKIMIWEKNEQGINFKSKKSVP